MRRFLWIRFRILVRQSRWGFALLGLWFAMGTMLFFHYEKLPISDALLSALYLRVHPGTLWELYTFWGQCVLFGIVISIFFLQALQRYNPQEGCRMLAGEMKDHVIVVGYGHLGERIVDFLRREARAYVLIDNDATAVEDLVREGEPVIVDNAKQESTLEEAGIERAQLVIVTANSIETALLVTKHARERNKKARIVVRCFMDEFVEILESLGADEVISSSKSAFNEIATRIAPAKTTSR
jgi:glutamyl-tRNA reductase